MMYLTKWENSLFELLGRRWKQAAAELCQAQLQLGLGLTQAVSSPDGLFFGTIKGFKNCHDFSWMRQTIFVLTDLFLDAKFKLLGWVGYWIVGLIGTITTSVPNLDWGSGLTLAMIFQMVIGQRIRG